MKVEDPAALRFILQDEIYLLQNDKTFAAKTLPEPVAEMPSQQLSEPITEPVAETPVITFNYLGRHKKKFLIVVHYPDQEFIEEVHLSALENILKRKEYSIDDVAIFNMAIAVVTDLEQLLTYFDPQKLLLLGKNALPAKMDALILNQPKPIANCMALYSFSFDDMMSNTENKKAFWEQMKNL